MRDKPCLTEADLIKAMAACRAEADKNNWKVAIAIVDDGGYLLHFNRMEGVAPISAEVAIGKARTAAMTRRPSKFFEDRVKERPAFANFPAGLLIQGAVPIMTRNECVGAIGVSGVASHEDEQIAKAGAAALE
jgi:glc operon protein GlcG